jgi:sulfotransferase
MKDMIKEILREEMGRMNKTYYFMAGLPRSGSTLISTILNQNPKFYSGPSSPVVPTMVAIEQSLSNDELYHAYPKPEQAREIIGSVLSTYYSDRQESIIFDKNRSWTSRIEYIKGYFGIEPKIICPVRDTSEILTSFISLIRRNPFEVNGRVNFIDEMLIKMNIPLTDDNRCEFLASSQGILGQSVESIREALMRGNEKSIHFVEYNDLVSNPQETIEKIYDFLGEEYYTHSFDGLGNNNKENDARAYGLVDIHEVRDTIEKTSNNPEDILSDNILKKCENTEFWRMLYDDDESDDYKIEETENTSNFFENEKEITMIGL